MEKQKVSLDGKISLTDFKNLVKMLKKDEPGVKSGLSKDEVREKLSAENMAYLQNYQEALRLFGIGGYSRKMGQITDHRHVSLSYSETMDALASQRLSVSEFLYEAAN